MATYGIAMDAYLASLIMDLEESHDWISAADVDEGRAKKREQRAFGMR